jgi:uncharacterized membrane protein (UPF0136 family)
MSTAELLTLIQDSAVAHSISKSNHLVGAGLQVVHVLGFITLLASLVLVSLRLLGLALKDQSLADVVKDANRLLYLGLLLATTSGLLMFVASAKLYYYKTAFELKMLLFITAVLLQFAVLRRLANRESTPPAVLRTAVAISLTVWFGIGFTGRMIGFT